MQMRTALQGHIFPWYNDTMIQWFFGHIVRKTADCLEKEIMEGSLPGKRARRRPRTAWQDNIKAWTGMTLEEALRATENREHWRMVVRDAAKPRIEDGWRTEQNRQWYQLIDKADYLFSL